mgnify:CR=1 FL=1
MVPWSSAHRSRTLRHRFPVFPNNGSHILVDGLTTKVKIKGN